MPGWRDSVKYEYEYKDEENNEWYHITEKGDVVKEDDSSVSTVQCSISHDSESTVQDMTVRAVLCCGVPVGWKFWSHSNIFK